MKIQFDNFLERQFDPKFSGTKLPLDQKESLLTILNTAYNNIKSSLFVQSNRWLKDSDNDFCKYLIIENFYNDIKQATIPITLDIYPFIRTDYSSRTPDELPVLTRFAQLPPGFNLPKAKYIVCILYSREQLKLEHEAKSTEPFYLDEKVEYGVIAIMGTELQNPDPYVPITMMRNALGLEFGGNNVPLDREMYLKSVEFWQNNILVK